MVILWKVVPAFTSLFEGLGATLPLPTRVVIWASKSVVVGMPFIVAGIMGMSYAIRRYYATPAGRKQIERDTRQWEETAAIMMRFLASED